MDIKLVINQACNGLELYFPTKPSETVLTQMKAAGWRYHRVKKCWYAKQTDSNRKLADAIISLEVQDDVVTVQADELNIQATSNGLIPSAEESTTRSCAWSAMERLK